MYLLISVGLYLGMPTRCQEIFRGDCVTEVRACCHVSMVAQVALEGWPDITSTPFALSTDAADIPLHPA